MLLTKSQLLASLLLRTDTHRQLAELTRLYIGRHGAGRKTERRRHRIQGQALGSGELDFTRASNAQSRFLDSAAFSKNGQCRSARNDNVG